MKMADSFVLVCVAAIIFLATSTIEATLLPNDEVKTLKEIAKKIGKTNWNFSVDPCSGELGWKSENPIKDFENALTCTCNTTICHVVSIILKGQSLPGVLPSEIVKLRNLEQIDFTRNYLSGSIPHEWGSTKLVVVSLGGNRLTGPIPKEIADISTLKEFVVGANRLSGALPPELGNFSNLERMLLSSNNFSGEIPKTFAKLTTLTDFRIDDNHFTGYIPNYIQNWTKLEKFFCIASGLDGPIPSGFANLENMTDLRITNLNGAETTTFPNITNMKKLTALIFRSCKISGNLPDFLGGMTKLKLIDLSFNKIEGTIPSSYSSLFKVNYMFLTGNSLTGIIPNWILQKGENIDLSYNNFTSAESTNCPQQSVNLFKSSSSNYNNFGRPVSCLKSFGCPRTFKSFHINCGGEEVIIGGTTYEEDTDRAGPSNFFQSKTNWAFSNTGNFIFDDRPTDNYISTNSSALPNITSQLEIDARLSPLSLTYYGFCLENGIYAVDLHFTETMFTDDETYSSLGRRVFDVYIQGVQVLKDFDIADEALGVGKEIMKTFTTTVTNGDLDIRFQWAGRGTTGIPTRGVYGPLISAISVNRENKSSSSLSGGAVVGIVAGVAILIFFVSGIIWLKCFRTRGRMKKHGIGEPYVHANNH